MTNEFLVRYASGIETTIHSTCETVEHFINEHFGSAWDGAGASVTLMNAAPDNAAAPVDIEAIAAQPQAANAAPASVLEEIRHEASDLLHKAEQALGLGEGD